MAADSLNCQSGSLSTFSISKITRPTTTSLLVRIDAADAATMSSSPANIIDISTDISLDTMEILLDEPYLFISADTLAIAGT